MAPRKHLGNGSAQANRGLPEASVAQKAAAAQIAALKAQLKQEKAGHDKATSQLAQQAEKNKKTTLELEKKLRRGESSFPSSSFTLLFLLSLTHICHLFTFSVPS